MRRLLTASAATLALLPGLAMAQDRPTLWDLLSVDRLVQSMMHSGIGLIRTQMDLQYEDLTVDLRRSRITMTGITAWPFLDWDEVGGCTIGIDQLALYAAPVDRIEQITLKARVSGLTVARDCMPSDMHEVMDLAGVTDLEMPRMTIDVDYGVPKSDALIRMYADITNVATLDITGDFAYFWFDGRDDFDEPMPVWFLRSATIAVENKGIWDSLSGMVPPPFTGDDAAQSVGGIVTEGLIELNREGRSEDTALSDEQKSFRDSAMATWVAFLANPETLVVETNIDGDVYMDFEAYDDSPAAIFADLQPRVTLAPSRVANVLSADLLRTAMVDGAEGMSDEDRLAVGTALITGAGAPRNIDAGIATLEPLAEAGDAAAALLMADAMAVRSPETAYRWALRAGKAGDAGATAMLDRLEQSMPFAKVLELQDEVSGTDSHPGSALRTIGGIREQAAMRMSGMGLARSYGISSMWAILAKAAGDPEASDILDEIDEVVRLEGADAIAAWTEIEARYAALAMEVWIGQNLPGRYAE